MIIKTSMMSYSSYLFQWPHIDDAQTAWTSSLLSYVIHHQFGPVKSLISIFFIMISVSNLLLFYRKVKVGILNLLKSFEITLKTIWTCAMQRNFYKSIWSMEIFIRISTLISFFNRGEIIFIWHMVVNHRILHVFYSLYWLLLMKTRSNVIFCSKDVAFYT